jgi:1-acyl-sn-glycerol-3-phosphate acyltransferase
MHDLGLTVVAEGPGRPVQEGGVLFVANHVSWLDICAIASLTGTLFVAKAEVGRWPIIGRIAANFGNFMHERGNLFDAARVKSRVAMALVENWSVTIFPEGTTGWDHRWGRSIRPSCRRRSTPARWFKP